MLHRVFYLQKKPVKTGRDQHLASASAAAACASRTTRGATERSAVFYRMASLTDHY